MALVFEQVIVEGLGDASYLVGDDAAGIAAVVDPPPEAGRYLALAREHGLAITHVLQTHLHEDFLSGASELARRAGGAALLVGGHDAPRYGHVHRLVHDGDRVHLGSIVLAARHTPGHTPEHMSWLLSRADSPDEPFGVLSGGSLLAGAAGRSDLLGPDDAQRLARAQYRTLHEVYLALPDHVMVYPTHVHGSPCGASIGDRSSTTIGHERLHNPFLQFDNEDDFVRHALGDLPPKPSYYARLKEANTAGATRTHDPVVAPLIPQAFEQAMHSPLAVVVDSRHHLAFGGGHIPDALNIGASPPLPIWAGWMLDADHPLLLVLDHDRDLDDVVRAFVRTGFQRFAGYLVGGIAAWQNAGKPLRTLPQLSVQQLARERERYDVLDVRSPGEWTEGHVPGARHLFVPELAGRLDELPRNQPMAVYCDSGYRASIAASLLRKNGFEQVANVPGSWQAWQAAGLPVER